MRAFTQENESKSNVPTPLRAWTVLRLILVNQWVDRVLRRFAQKENRQCQHSYLSHPKLSWQYLLVRNQTQTYRRKHLASSTRSEQKRTRSQLLYGADRRGNGNTQSSWRWTVRVIYSLFVGYDIRGVFIIFMPHVSCSRTQDHIRRCICFTHEIFHMRIYVCMRATSTTFSPARATYVAHTCAFAIMVHMHIETHATGEPTCMTQRSLCFETVCHVPVDASIHERPLTFVNNICLARAGGATA